jgi:hypothetical protein
VVHGEGGREVESYAVNEKCNWYLSGGPGDNMLMCRRSILFLPSLLPLGHNYMCSMHALTPNALLFPLPHLHPTSNAHSRSSPP